MALRPGSVKPYAKVAKRAKGLRVSQKGEPESRAEDRGENESSENFIAGAIKRPGALTAAVGGKPSQHMDKVRALMQHGTPIQKKQASFYANVLAPAAKRKAAA